MDVLILNGALAEADATERTCRLACDELARRGCDVHAMTLRELDIEGCMGCYKCWTKSPGECVRDDPSRESSRRLIRSDVVVFLTPVTFGGYSSQLKKALDRMIPNISPMFMKVEGETHHKPRYDRYPKLFGLGVLNEADEEAEDIFAHLVGRNAINFHTPLWVACCVEAEQSEEEMVSMIREALDALEVPA